MTLALTLLFALNCYFRITDHGVRSDSAANVTSNTLRAPVVARAGRADEGHNSNHTCANEVVVQFFR